MVTTESRDKPLFSILCPTRKRPHNVRRLLDSICSTSESKFELVLYVDDDDDTVHRLPIDPEVRIVHGPRITMSDMWNKCAEVAQGDYLMFVDDEAIFRTLGWDTMVDEAFSQYPDRAVMVYGNDSIHADVLAAYFFVHKVWLRIFGRLCPPYFTAGYADVWPFEVSHAVGRTHFLPGLMIENMGTKDPWDETHQEGHERNLADFNGDKYNELQPERAKEVAALARYISSFPTAL